MKILHYSLGFPPFRTGGMIKFCMDLMDQQKKEGNEVTLLWPGKILPVFTKTRVVRHRPVNGINSCEIMNPLPVPYDEGVIDTALFTQPGDKKVYAKLLKKLQPDVIHIHTFMGLHKNFLEAAKEAGIHTVYTTHDFYPVCPRVTLFRHGSVCKSRYSCDECSKCNSNALSYKKMAVLQSDLYRLLKDSKAVKKLRARHRGNALAQNTETRPEHETPAKREDYKALREHYHQMLRLIDKVHYNSSISKQVYEDFFDIGASQIVNITHSAIRDQKALKTFNNGVLRIRYLGGNSAAKGYYLLRDALDMLWEKNRDFQLDINFDPAEKRPYMVCHGRYGYHELKAIFEESDILVCPSIWFETFGYTVLEALSFGVPVIISDSVGAKDILADDAGIIIDDITAAKLCETLNGITAEKLKEMNRAIVDRQKITTIESMSKSIMEEVYRV